MSLFDFLPWRKKKPIVISILICHIPERFQMLHDLLDNLIGQALDLYLCKAAFDVEFVVTTPDEYELNIGAKRNALLARAKGDYVAFIDDDDNVSEDYFLQLLPGMQKGVDCCSLIGELTSDGENPQPFHHSIKYDKYTHQGGVFFRPPNHLNCIKASIAKTFKFPEKNWAEDSSWAMQICNARVLKTEHEVVKTIYYYKYISNKPKPTHA